MPLCVALDLLYLSVSNSRSRVGGYHFLGNKVSTNLLLANKTIIYYTLIHIEVSILRHIISTTSESKIAAAFVNTKLAIPEYIYLLKMEYLQPATPLEIDNTIAYSILTKQLISK